jgi:hypothetical protein
MEPATIKWIGGFLVSAAWSGVNYLLTIQILKISMLEKPKKNLGAMLLIKFPVLYLLGFLILATRFFPIYSLLTGLVSILFIMGMSRLWPKRT